MRKLRVLFAFISFFASMLSPMLFAQSKNAQDAFDALDNEQQKASAPVKQQQPAPKPVVKAVSSPAIAPASAKPVTTPAQSVVVKETKAVASNKRIEVKDNVVSFIGEDGKAVKTIQLKDEQKNDAEYVLVNRVLAFPAGNKQYVGIGTEQSRVLPEYSIVSTTTFQYYGVDGNILWKANNVVLENTPPAVSVSSYGNVVFISTGIRPENVDQLSYPQSVAIYDAKGNLTWVVGEFREVSDVQMSPNGKYACFAYSARDNDVLLFLNIGEKSKIVYMLDKPEKYGYGEISDTGAIKVISVKHSLVNANDPASEVKETITTIYENQFR